MRKAFTDSNDVQMTDVLCDFCHREWQEQTPMIEGHHGSIICGNCLTVAYTETAGQQDEAADKDYSCTMCLESRDDRRAQDRDDAAWQSPMHPEAFICLRCIKLAAKSLNRDKQFEWSTPQ